MEVVEPVLLFLIALLSTTGLSAVGLAGGMLIVPFLILVFGLEPRYAAGTSVFAIFLGVLSAALTYFSQRRVDVKLALLFDTFDVIGVLIGTYLVVILKPEITALLMGLFLIFSAWRLWLGGEKKSEPREKMSFKPILKRRFTDRYGKTYEYELGLLELALSQFASFLSGIATGLFGIGGGAVDTTIMILIGIPPHVAVATAVFGMTITKIAGVLSHLFMGNLILKYGVPLAIGTIIGGQLGPRISRRAKPTFLKKALSMVVFLIGLRMMLEIF